MNKQSQQNIAHHPLLMSLISWRWNWTRPVGTNSPPPTSLSYSQLKIYNQLPENTRRRWGQHSSINETLAKVSSTAMPTPSSHKHIPHPAAAIDQEVPGAKASHSPTVPSLFAANLRKTYGNDDIGTFVVEHLNTSNIGLFNAVNSNISHLSERIWVGSLGVSTENWSKDRKIEVAATLLDDFETVPVYLTDNDIKLHYNLFCKQLLWPALFTIYPQRCPIGMDGKRAHMMPLSQSLRRSLTR